MIRPKRTSEEGWGRERAWATRFRALVKPRALNIMAPAMAVAAFALLISGSTLSKLGIDNGAQEPTTAASQEVLGVTAESPAATVPVPPDTIEINSSTEEQLPMKRSRTGDTKRKALDNAPPIENIVGKLRKTQVIEMAEEALGVSEH